MSTRHSFALVAATCASLLVGVQSNGRIIVVSNRSTGPETTEVLVTRFTPRGRLHRSFGTDGQVACQPARS